MKKKTIIILILILFAAAIGGGIGIYFAQKNNTKTSDIQDNEPNKKDDKVDESKDEYKKIEFTKDSYVTGDTINIADSKEFKYEFKDSKVYLNEVETDIKSLNGRLYVVDIDDDNVKELISVTSDDMISPPTNHYHIYKFDNDNYKEIATISIMGSIDCFYIKDNDIKVTYEPYEAAPGYIGEAHFTINY